MNSARNAVSGSPLRAGGGPFPGRQPGRFARCRLCPFGSHSFFGESMNSARNAVSGSPSRAAVVATIGKSQPQVSGHCQSFITRSSVRRMVSRSTPSPCKPPSAISIDGWSRFFSVNVAGQFSSDRYTPSFTGSAESRFRTSSHLPSRPSPSRVRHSSAVPRPPPPHPVPFPFPPDPQPRPPLLRRPQRLAPVLQLKRRIPGGARVVVFLRRNHRRSQHVPPVSQHPIGRAH